MLRQPDSPLNTQRPIFNIHPVYRWFDGALVSEGDWPQMPSSDKRLALAVGNAPLPDNRHRLPALSWAAPDPWVYGPDPRTEFVAELCGARRDSLLLALERVPSDERAGLILRGERDGFWAPIGEIPDGFRGRFALCWSLSSLGGTTLAERAASLGRHEQTARSLAESAGGTLRLCRTIPEMAERAGVLRELRRLYSSPIELRLIARGRPFPTRDLFRAALSLGLSWGNLDLFHLFDAGSGESLFWVWSPDNPGGFSPERAAQGEALTRISVGFELPNCPDPLAVFDSAALALAFFREQLGGIPARRDGSELDADTLETLRERIEAESDWLASLGLAPGSTALRRLFP